MKKSLALVIGFLLVGFNLFAADGDLIVQGSVGIGISNPQYKLHATSPSGTIRAETTGSGVYAGQFYGITHGLFGEGGSYGVVGNITSETGGISLLGNGKPSGYGIVTVGESYNYLSGNVGIGASAPYSKLAVGGNGNSVFKVYIEGIGSDSNSYGMVIGKNGGGGNNNFWVRDDGLGYVEDGWIYSSDSRNKENIIYFSSGIDKVIELKPAQFNYIGREGIHFGFIAQDVEKIIPESVQPINEKGILGLRTDFILPYLVNSVKELHAQLLQLKAENSQLKERVDALEKR